MERVIILLCFISIFFICVQCTDDNINPTYTTKYDNVDIDEILTNDRLMNNYLNCLLNKGKCTQDAEELKKTLPDAIENDCSKCSDVQKEKSLKFVCYLMEHKEDWWNELEKKYDPAQTYKQKANCPHDDDDKDCNDKD